MQEKYKNVFDFYGIDEKIGNEEINGEENDVEFAYKLNILSQKSEFKKPSEYKLFDDNKNGSIIIANFLFYGDKKFNIYDFEDLTFEDINIEDNEYIQKYIKHFQNPESRLDNNLFFRRLNNEPQNYVQVFKNNIKFKSPQILKMGRKFFLRSQLINIDSRNQISRNKFNHKYSYIKCATTDLEYKEIYDEFIKLLVKKCEEYEETSLNEIELKQPDKPDFNKFDFTAILKETGVLERKIQFDKKDIGDTDFSDLIFEEDKNDLSEIDKFFENKESSFKTSVYHAVQLILLMNQEYCEKDVLKLMLGINPYLKVESIQKAIDEMNIKKDSIVNDGFLKNQELIKRMNQIHSLSDLELTEEELSNASMGC